MTGADSAVASAQASHGSRRSVLAAAALYFAMVFAAGLILGPARVLWLEPWLGRTLAVLCETPLLLCVMGVAARLAPSWAGAARDGISLIAIGLLALGFQQIADLSVGFGLRGMTLSEQLALFSTPPGWVYGFDLVAFALAPLILARHVKAPQPEV